MQVPGVDYEDLISQIVTCTGMVGCAFGNCTGSSSLYAMLCVLLVDNIRKLGTFAVCQDHAPNRRVDRIYILPENSIVFLFSEVIQQQLRHHLQNLNVQFGNANLTSL